VLETYISFEQLTILKEGEVRMWMLIAMLFLVISELVWKAIALWAAAKKNDRIWFVIMFILSTGGILPIVYLKFYTDFFKCYCAKKKKRR